MKNRLVLFFALQFFLHPSVSRAQSFTILTDTFYINATPAFAMYTDSIVTGQAPVTLMWGIAESNFPADWISAAHYFSICDNSYCRYLSSIWPTGTSNSTFQYAAHDTGVLTLVMQLPAYATAGCYYLTIKVRNNALFIGGYTSETWIVCNDATALSVPGDHYCTGPVLYPNPAHDKLNLHADAGTTEVAIYNVLGDRLKTIRCINGAATVTINDLSAGMYIARFMDADGTITAMKKFSKE